MTGKTTPGTISKYGPTISGKYWKRRKSFSQHEPVPGPVPVFVSLPPKPHCWPNHVAVRPNAVSGGFPRWKTPQFPDQVWRHFSLGACCCHRGLGRRTRVEKTPHVAEKMIQSNNFSHKTYYIYMKFRFRTIITKKKHKCLFPGDPKLPPTSLRFSTAALGGGSILLGNGWAAPGSRAGVCSLVFAPGNDKNDIEKTRRIRKKNLKRLIWGASFCYRTFLKDDESTVYVCACFNLCLDFFLWAYFPFLSGGDPSFKKIVGERLSSQTTSGVTRTWGAFIQSSLLNSCHRSPGYLVAEVVFYL